MMPTLWRGNPDAVYIFGPHDTGSRTFTVRQLPIYRWPCVSACAPQQSILFRLVGAGGSGQEGKQASIDRLTGHESFKNKHQYQHALPKAVIVIIKVLISPCHKEVNRKAVELICPIVVPIIIYRPLQRMLEDGLAKLVSRYPTHNIVLAEGRVKPKKAVWVLLKEPR